MENENIRAVSEAREETCQERGRGNGHREQACLRTQEVLSPHHATDKLSPSAGTETGGHTMLWPTLDLQKITLCFCVVADLTRLNGQGCNGAHSCCEEAHLKRVTAASSDLQGEKTQVELLLFCSLRGRDGEQKKRQQQQEKAAIGAGRISEE
ncbi:unnamed protein product [Pleuronectes platessa]|uniref:Uncharacterized protein n=1 Tax=Pleuronectes platessa TaxID=8262 RepID=A0A9N7Z9Y1_PLEPL|nr:unnamed protein product [Pleuronectes platessa]